MPIRSLAPFYPDGAITFRLGRSVFGCDPDPPPSVVMDMVLGLSTTAKGYRRYDMETMLRAILALVPEDQHERLRRVMSGKRRPVTAPLLGKVVIWLAETTMGRPTVPSGGWSSGRPRTGTTCAVTC